MTQNEFPSIKTSFMNLAGYFKYEPWVHFDAGLMSNLQQILDAVLLIDGSENPEVIADWREAVENTENTITHRSNIILYRDGADCAEENNGHYENIGLLFCREDQTVTPKTTNYRVHIPETDWQDKLLANVDSVFDDLKKGNPDKLNAISGYLASIINDQKKWQSLNELLNQFDLMDTELEDSDYL